MRFNDITIDRATLTITIGSVVRKFPNRRPSPYSKHSSLLFEIAAMLILNGWTTKQRIWDRLYGDDPSGGPECGVKIVDIRFHQWRDELQSLGLTIVSEKRCGVTRYKIASLNKAVAA